MCLAIPAKIIQFSDIITTDKRSSADTASEGKSEDEQEYISGFYSEAIGSEDNTGSDDNIGSEDKFAVVKIKDENNIVIAENNRYSKFATVDIMGVENEVNIQLIERPRIGDYVLIHAGCAIQKIDSDYFDYLTEFFGAWLEEH